MFHAGNTILYSLIKTIDFSKYNNTNNSYKIINRK